MASNYEKQVRAANLHAKRTMWAYDDARKGRQYRKYKSAKRHDFREDMVVLSVCMALIWALVSNI